MSNGWVCDKCNRHFLQDSTEERYHIAAWLYGKRSPESEINLDLCEKCKQRFDKWIKDKPYLGTDWTFLAMAEAPIYSSKDVTPYGWPVFEDGTPIKEWDEVLDQHGHGFVAHCFSHYGNWWCVSSSHGYATRSGTGVFKRSTKEQMAEYYRKWPDEKKQPSFVIKDGADFAIKDGADWTRIGYVADGGFKFADDVNHPKHYDNGKVECIDWIEERLSPEEFKGYLQGCALKYQFRYEDKGKPVEDLRKAQWYLKKLEELA